MSTATIIEPTGTTFCSPPWKIAKGKDLEEFCLTDAEWSERRGFYSMTRYGVQVVYHTEYVGNKPSVQARPVSSLPDFDGVYPPNGQQFIIEAKVCSGASLPLQSDHFRDRQLSHMLRRAKFGVPCFILIHFNGRTLKTKSDQPLTIAFPVFDEHEFWQAFSAGKERSISREQAMHYGAEIPWHLPNRCKTKRPFIQRILMLYF